MEEWLKMEPKAGWRILATYMSLKRRTLGLSQSEVAEEIGVTQASFSRWELDGTKGPTTVHLLRWIEAINEESLLTVIAKGLDVNNLLTDSTDPISS